MHKLPRFHFCLVLFLLMLAGCGRELTREKAASLLSTKTFEGRFHTIQLKGDFGTHSTVSAPEGLQLLEKLISGSDSEIAATYAKMGIWSGSIKENGKALRDLVSRKVINGVSWSYRDIGHVSKFISYEGVGIISDDVKKYCRGTGKTQEYRDGDATCAGLVAERRFDHVTGITGDQSHKVVEYTIKVTATELGKRLKMTFSDERASAAFRLYDDGWRIVQRF